MRFVKPLDEKILKEVCTGFKHVITIEDGALEGGFGSAVLEWMSDHHFETQITRIGIPNEFIEQGTVAQLQHIVGLDAEAIIRCIETIAAQ